MEFRGSWAYHRDCPEGKVFKDEDEYNAARASGWVDAPWRINDPFPAVASPEPVQEIIPKQVEETIKVVPKKPGRPSKKFKGGK